MAKSFVRFLRKTLTKLLWLMSVLVIIFVVLLSLAKLTLPYWTEDKARMIALAEAEFGGQFDYQSLDVDWTKFKPSIFMEDVQWSSDDGDVSLGSSKSLIVLNFWESLFKGYLVTEKVELNTVTLDIAINESAASNDFSPNVELFLKRYPEIINQESIAIDNVSINFRKNDQSKKVQVSQLNFIRRDQQRQLTLDFQSEFASQGKVIVESDGKPFADDNPIDIYGLLRDFDLVNSSQFFNLPQGIPVELADTEFWLSYEGDFPVSGKLLFKADSTDSKVAKLDAEINYIHEGRYTIFSSDKFHVVERQESGDLKRYNSYFKVVRDKVDEDTTVWRFEAQNTPIGYFSSLSIPFMPQDIRQHLIDLKPEGDLVSLDLETLQKNKELVPINGRAKVDSFSVQSTANSPGVMLKSLFVNKLDDGWTVRASTEDSNIKWPGVFKNNIPVDTLSLDAWISFKESPFIKVNSFALDNPDTEVFASGKIEIVDGDPDMSIYAEARNVNIAALETYWPRNEMDEEVLSFLDQSLISGQVDFGKLTWRGNIENFPYENNDGQFDIQAKVSDSQFNFDKDWPQLENLSADVHFLNNKLMINATSGSVLGNDIGNVEGVIESIFTENSVLKMDIENQVAYQPYRDLFFESPIHQWLGDDLIDLKFSGKLDHKLSVSIPLSEDDDNTRLTGNISFNGQSIQLDGYNFALDSLTGSLHYTERGAYSKNLKGEIWKSPVTLDITVDEYTESDDLVNINAESMFNLARAVEFHNIQAPLKIEGESPVTLHYRKDVGGSASLILRSDLKGTLIEGPSWLSKSKSAAASFLATLFQTEGRIQSRTIYRDTVSAQLNFSQSNPEDINGVIALGELATNSIQVPPQGVAIQGFFPEIHSYEWINSLQMKKEGDFFWPKWIDHIAVRTDLFTVAGQSLHEVSLTDSLLDDESVRFNVSAKEGNGSLTLFTDGRKHVVVDSLDIELQPFSSLSESELDLQKDALDKWQLECFSCKINGIDTGKLTLVSTKEGDAVVLKGDSQIKGQLAAYLEGRWQDDQSAVNIRFTTQDTGALLKRWGYGDGLKETEATGSIALSWPGGFHDISLETLNGNISLDTGPGAVKELSDRQARVFSLFSLQSVRRRLSLDFSDLFEDGFFYDTMRGVFTIKNGVVHSDDVFINGTAADVEVKGSIDLVEQTVDQNVTVVPKLGSSLPVLAGWAIEPTTGLIMLLVNKIFEPVIDVVVSIEYKVTGDLANPEVVELSKKSKEVTVPESELKTEQERQEPTDAEPESDEEKLPSEQETAEDINDE
ncbi:YhdP family protein [Kangiella sediminilitoris]|uniref:Putative membrane protein n=1 Tax=Kangiella sediminilitoris TaxID=1144748 RepID=A0A1B3BCM8_9GAMM|nr:YhdP family protein [Kangiella sediminilitoris]AOE50513.1 Putative membrane protein [Kangiella sediminilitoris]